MAHSLVWGLDIGNSAVKAIKVLRAGDSAVIVDMDIVDLPGSGEESNRVEKVQEALRTLVSKHEFGSTPVYLALPGDKCMFRDIQLPAGTEAKLEELVNFEARQQIPKVEEVEYAYERYEDPTGGVGVVLVAIRKSDVQSLLEMAKQFKINVQGMSVAPIALFNFIKYEFDPAETVLVLDTGYRGTDFVVMRGRYLYTRTVPIGGREITRALEQKFKVPYEKAEELKKNIGQSKQAEKLMSVIDPTLRQLSIDVQRTIGFYKSKARGQRIAQAFLMGHTFRLPKVADMLAGQIREANFAIVESLQRTQLDRAVNSNAFQQEFPTLAVAIGLGIQGVGLGALQINLLPKAVIQEIKRRGQWVWGAAAAAAIILTMYLGYRRATQELATIAALKAPAAGAFILTNQTRKDHEAAVKGLEARQRRLDQIAGSLRDRGRINEIFTKVLRLEDEGKPFFGFSERRQVYLTNFYASRIPFQSGKALPGPEGLGMQSGRNSMLKELLDSPGARKFYQDALQSAQGGARARAEPPFIVALSMELEGQPQDVVRPLEKLYDLLSKIQGVSKERVLVAKVKQSALEIKETRPELGIPGGQPLKFDPEKLESVPHRLTGFHLLFRWDPPEAP